MTEPYSPDPARRAPDLGAFARAVRFRDRAVKAALTHHQRVGLEPSNHYARATFDAIVQMVREDERDQLTAAGRLLPADAESRTEWAVYWHGTDDDDAIRYSEQQFPSRDAAERRGPQMVGIHGITRWTLDRRGITSYPDGSTLIGPWLPAPTEESR